MNFKGKRVYCQYRIIILRKKPDEMPERSHRESYIVHSASVAAKAVTGFPHTGERAGHVKNINGGNHNEGTYEYTTPEFGIA